MFLRIVVLILGFYQLSLLSSIVIFEREWGMELVWFSALETVYYCLYFFLLGFLTFLSLSAFALLEKLKINYHHLLKIIFGCLLVFVAQYAIEIAFIAYFEGAYTGDVFSEFVLFSLSWFVGIRHIPFYLLQLCNHINVFELTFVLLLACYLKALFPYSFLKRLLIVVCCYGVVFFMYVLMETYNQVMK